MTIKNIYHKYFYQINIGIIFCYAALTLFGVLHHEPWRDEADPWVVARDAPLSQYWHVIGGSQTPMLWYLFLRPFAQIGLPFITASLLHWLIAIAIVAIFLSRSPFPLITKLLFVFGYYMSYEYSVIARVYAPAILFLFLIAANYGGRLNKPYLHCALIALLYQATSYVFFFASGILLIFAIEVWRARKTLTKKFHHYILAIAIPSLTGLVTALMVRPRPDAANFLTGIKRDFQPQNIVIAMKNAFFPHVSLSDYSTNIHDLYILAAIVIFIIIFSALALLTFFRKPAVLAIYSIGIAWLFFIFCCKYKGDLRHHALIMILTFFCLWLLQYYNPVIGTKEDKRPEKEAGYKNLLLWLINFSLVFSLYSGYKAYIDDYKNPFSGAKDMAGFIANSGYQNRVIIASPIPYTSSLSAYLPRVKFWYPGWEGFGSYTIWDNRLDKDCKKDGFCAVDIAKKHFPSLKKMLFIFAYKVEDPQKLGFRELHYSPGTMESYWLYIKED